MAKQLRGITEGTRGMGIPDGQMRAPDFGVQQAFRGLESLGQGMQNLGITLNRQQAQQELLEQSTEFDRSIIELKKRAALSDEPLEKVMADVDQQMKSMIKHHSGQFKTKLAREAFETQASGRREKIYAEFAGEYAAVKREDLAFRNAKLYQELLASGDLSKAELTRRMGRESGLNSNERYDTIKTRWEIENEEIALLEAQEKGTVEALEALKPKHTKRSVEAALIRKRIEVKTEKENFAAFKAVKDLERELLDLPMQDRLNLDDIRTRIENKLSPTGMSELDVEKFVEGAYKQIADDYAYQKTVHVDENIQSWRDLPAPIKDNLSQQERDRFDLIMRKKGQEAESRGQKWAADRLMSRIMNGQLEGEDADPNMMTDVEDAREIPHREAAMINDISNKKIWEMAEDGHITWNRAVGIWMALRNQTHGQQIEAQLLKEANDIHNSVINGDGKFGRFNPETERGKAQVQTWYKHNILADGKGGFTSSIFQANPELLNKRLRSIDQFVRAHGILPKEFMRDITGMADFDDSAKAVTAARILNKFLEEDAQGSLWKQMDRGVRDNIRRIANVNMEATDKPVQDARKLPDLKERSRLELGSAEKRHDIKVGDFWNEEVNNDGTFPVLDAQGEFRDIVAEQFVKTGDYRGALNHAKREMNNRYPKNKRGFRHRGNAYGAAEDFGIHPRHMERQAILLVAGEAMGYNRMTDAEIDRQMKLVWGGKDRRLLKNGQPNPFHRPNNVNLKPGGRDNATNLWSSAVYRPDLIGGGASIWSRERQRWAMDGEKYKSQIDNLHHPFADWSRQEKIRALVLTGMRPWRAKGGEDKTAWRAFQASHPGASKELSGFLSIYKDANTRDVTKDAGRFTDSMMVFPNGKARIIIETAPGVNFGAEDFHYQIKLVREGEGAGVPIPLKGPDGKPIKYNIGDSRFDIYDIRSDERIKSDAEREESIRKSEEFRLKHLGGIRN